MGRLEAVQLGLEIAADKFEALLDRLCCLSSHSREIAVYCWRGGMLRTLLPSLALWLFVVFIKEAIRPTVGRSSSIR